MNHDNPAIEAHDCTIMVRSTPWGGIAAGITAAFLLCFLVAATPARAAIPIVTPFEEEVEEAVEEEVEEELGDEIEQDLEQQVLLIPRLLAIGDLRVGLSVEQDVVVLHEPDPANDVKSVERLDRLLGVGALG